MSEEVDPFDLQIKAEELARAEYQDAYTKLEDRAAEIRIREEKWRSIINRLGFATTFNNGQNIINDEPDFEEVLDRLVFQVGEYAKLEKMFKLINENELLTSQWNRLVMSIRMVGGDSNDQ